MGEDSLAHDPVRFSREIGAFRQGRWITADRVVLYGGALLGLTLVCAVGIGFANGFDRRVDFVSFWAASWLTLHGRPEAAYDWVAHTEAQHQPPDGPLHVFFYPPIFLLVCWPLALLPYAWSAVCWLAVTGSLCFASLRRSVPAGAAPWIAAALFPPAWMNLSLGQTGFLTTGIFGFALRWLDRRPVCAGIAFGCLSYKPQFAIVIPVFLIAARRWRTFFAAAAAALGLAVLSAAAFGLDAWLAFVGLPAQVRAFLGPAGERRGSSISFMGTALSLDVPHDAAFAFQAAATLAVCAAVALMARRTWRPGAIAAALCVFAIIASPWLHRYDLVLLALPMAWIASDGMRTGFLPWEKSAVLLIYLSPVATIAAFGTENISIDMPFVLLLLWLVWRRAEHRGGGAAAVE